MVILGSSRGHPSGVVGGTKTCLKLSAQHYETVTLYLVLTRFNKIAFQCEGPNGK